MVRTKEIITEQDIVRNTLLNTMYDCMNVVGQQIEETYFETITDIEINTDNTLSITRIPKRLKKISKGTIVLEKIINEIKHRVVVTLTSDEKYDKDKVIGYLKSLKITTDKNEQECDSFFIRLLLENCDCSNYDDCIDYTPRIYKPKLNSLKGIEEKQQQKIIVEEENYYTELEKLQEMMMH